MKDSDVESDVALVLEGTYPYVPGGVSSWVHQLLRAYPERRFSLIHIGPSQDFYDRQVFELPDNVIEMQNIYCSGTLTGSSKRVRAPWFKSRTSSRVLRAIRRLHLETEVDDELIQDLCSGDLSVAEFIYGDESFEFLRDELYPKLGGGTPFTDFFWHFRALHTPLLRLLNGDYAESKVYHAVSAGYAGLVGVVASVRHQRPFFLTEHGIYAREREIELARASWICDVSPSMRLTARPSPLRKLWSHFFKMLSRVAYHRATRVVTLSETNRRRQLRDGADPAKTDVVPNGVDKTQYEGNADADESAEERPRGMRLGFVGRVVPIKDVVTLLRAFQLARKREPMELWIVGPDDEDPDYAKRCRALTKQLGISRDVHFLGRQPMKEVYPKLDVVVLTSVSEGQPLVILEAFANKVPVVATDVGACRELLEGAGGEDRKLGPAGIITRVANPMETAGALTYLAKNPSMLKQMGKTGYERVTKRYQQSEVISRYDRLYKALESSSLA